MLVLTSGQSAGMHGGVPVARGVLWAISELPPEGEHSGYLPLGPAHFVHAYASR
jgi:hypothetical protein